MNNSLVSLREKILPKIKKVFIHEVESYENCINCGKKLIGNQRKFCSRSCCNSYYNNYNNPEKNQVNIVERGLK